ncbi:hypothetical protein K438DRAFT_1753332 [Mycena galopus ATCC 62051]|nr:hypothetical protein K438DRAFT_1753332 [Mycena galopus ATCC 62051]
MGFAPFHVSKAGAAFRHAGSSASSAKISKRTSTTPDASCAAGAFYSSPALGATVDSMTPLNVTWNPSLDCLQPAPSNVDILLSAPGAATPLLHTWSAVPYSTGYYNLTLLPRWWNSTASQQLQLMIVSSGTPVYLNPIPAGPVFNATYTAPTSGPVAPAADTAVTGASTTVVSGALGGVSSHKVSPGGKAAAVLLPLIFVALLGFAYLKWKRGKGQAKRSEWSEKLDKRMSTISVDWKSITPGGAKEAVRHSMAGSAFSVGAIRTGAVEGEPVVMGEKTRGGSIEISEKDLPRTTLGSGVGVGVGARRPKKHAATPDRGSRAVSFADSAHPRPSTGSRPYSRGSRAFHTASYAADDDEPVPAMPPVPALPSPSRAGAFGAIERISSGAPAERGNSVYQNGAAWSSGERVEGVDGGYGAQSVSPTGRVHTINYPSEMLNTSSAYDDSAYDVNGTGNNGFAYGTPSAMDGSYFSPVTPTPNNITFSQAYPSTTGSAVYGQDPSADSAYAPNTFGAFPPSPDPSVSSGGIPSGATSPRQTAGPLTLTPEDIRRRMTVQHSGNANQEGWRQSVDEVFGALSMMRTGSLSRDSAGAAPEADDDAGEYLFAPQQAETVFQYPGTPAPGSGFGGAEGIQRDPACGDDDSRFLVSGWSCWGESTWRVHALVLGAAASAFHFFVWVWSCVSLCGDGSFI